MKNYKDLNVFQLDMFPCQSVFLRQEIMQDIENNGTWSSGRNIVSSVSG